jgi:transposase
MIDSAPIRVRPHGANGPKAGRSGHIGPRPPVMRPACNPTLARARNRIERFSGQLKHVRAVATRWDTRDENLLASVHLASLRIRLRTGEPVT